MNHEMERLRMENDQLRTELQGEKGKVVACEEQVNHPSHYNQGRIEVIEFIEDQGFGDGFCLGNAIKYIARAGKKDPEKTLEDLKKARWYLSRQIEILEAMEQDRPPVRPNDMNPRN